MSDDFSKLDLEMLNGLQDLLGDKFLLLITTFISDCEARLGRLSAAAASMNLEIIKNEAHGIKGSSRNIGANGLAALCEEIERQARDGDLDDIEKKISSVQQVFAAIKQELTSYLP